ncbi:helix-turn-helix domain-containing protein [Lysinibacillus xylanilyticus]|uniref:helix-turn-helix domain-containing protein n=1 Tax=Lysinibacillus xylanilyticus TaxID=582475 RepID=UPI003CFFEE96
MFPDILKKHRKSLSLSQEQVSKMAGIERSYYTKIENGLRPSVKVAQAIGRVLGIDWTIFFNENCAKNAQIKSA